MGHEGECYSGALSRVTKSKEPPSRVRGFRVRIPVEGLWTRFYFRVELLFALSAFGVVLSRYGVYGLLIKCMVRLRIQTTTMLPPRTTTWVTATNIAPHAQSTSTLNPTYIPKCPNLTTNIPNCES